MCNLRLQRNHVAASGISCHRVLEPLQCLESPRSPRRLGALRARGSPRRSHTCLLQRNTRLVPVSYNTPLVSILQFVGAHDIPVWPPATCLSLPRICVDTTAESGNPRGSKADRCLSSLLLIVVCRRYIVTALGKQQKNSYKLCPDAESNCGPFLYKRNALPLSYQGCWNISIPTALSRVTSTRSFYVAAATSQKLQTRLCGPTWNRTRAARVRILCPTTRL